MDVKTVLQKYLPSIDDDTLEYFQSMVAESCNAESFKETLSPFIESYGLASDTAEAEAICDKILLDIGGLSSQNSNDDEFPMLLEKSVLMSDVNKNHLSAEDQAQVDKLWGFENVRKTRNTVMEFSEAASARYERKAAKEQRKWLEDLEAQFVGEEDNGQISTMMLPEYNTGSNEKDIHVHNFSISYGGKTLLEGADLKLVYGRRYGLIGRNGIGKTTLLKHMANFSIEGFPRHHRILHVKQEVKSSTMSVLEVVLDADIERKTLLQREGEINELLQSSSQAEFDALSSEMQELQERMSALAIHSAEARAASILSGLQFTEEMQSLPTQALSGGWRMRVALAAALFIEPDVLMLDEPTNHLDLEAVLWLETYLKGYEKTVVLVSHDRAFLNDVCTDIVLFDKLKLIYYKGNYDNYAAVRKELEIVQQKQYEAQQVKLSHMQEFVDKFRYNAKRAALVQSRIKAIEKETIIEAVEEEESFSFTFSDAGQLGRPIIQIEGVTFGYSTSAAASAAAAATATANAAGTVGEGPAVVMPADNKKKDGQQGLPLFINVHLGLDQASRVALVGPNGAGKSTLLNLIQNKLNPSDGIIRINPQLRIGIFTQHHMDSFNLSISPLQNLMNIYPGSMEAELRAHLGRYEVTGNDALKPMKFSSGGQKSRVAFASLTYGKPHIVIMDEPTNHLDMGAIEALINALKAFTGGVLVVSHDQHFIVNVCRELWMIADRKVVRFEGSFEDYKKVVFQKNSSSNSTQRKK